MKRKNNKSEQYAMKILICIQTLLLLFCVTAFAQSPSPAGTDGQPAGLSAAPVSAAPTGAPAGDSAVAAQDAASNATPSDVPSPAAIPEATAVASDFPDWITSQYPPYSARDKIDPFVSFVKIREYELMQAAKQAKVEKKATTPLETVDVHSLKLIGIINKEGGTPLAMVELPDGKGYLIRPGMVLGLYDGIVTSIGNEMIVVEEDVIDVFGEAKKRTINLRLRQEKE